MSRIRRDLIKNILHDYFKEHLEEFPAIHEEVAKELDQKKRDEIADKVKSLKGNELNSFLHSLSELEKNKPK